MTPETGAESDEARRALQLLYDKILQQEVEHMTPEQVAQALRKRGLDPDAVARRLKKRLEQRLKTKLP